jgi:hypothetical protein
MARALAAALAVGMLALGAMGCVHHSPGAPSVAPSIPPTAQPPMEPTNVIQLRSLAANDVVTSPLVVTGAARNNWFFEAQFPVHLVDDSGRELARAAAHAQGDGTAQTFVPFTVTLFFVVPPGDSVGTLVFQTDNPSGIKELQREKRLPVRFAP